MNVNNLTTEVKAACSVLLFISEFIVHNYQQSKMGPLF